MVFIRSCYSASPKFKANLLTAFQDLSATWYKAVLPPWKCSRSFEEFDLCGWMENVRTQRHQFESQSTNLQVTKGTILGTLIPWVVLSTGKQIFTWCWEPDKHAGKVLNQKIENCLLFLSPSSSEVAVNMMWVGTLSVALSKDAWIPEGDSWPGLRFDYP